MTCEREQDLEMPPEQVAEIERRSSEDEPCANEEEVRALYARLTAS
jgi:hypothetical protein